MENQTNFDVEKVRKECEDFICKVYQRTITERPSEDSFSMVYEDFKRTFIFLPELTQKLRTIHPDLSFVHLMKDHKKENDHLFQVWYTLIFTKDEKDYMIFVPVKHRDVFPDQLKTLWRIYSKNPFQILGRDVTYSDTLEKVVYERFDALTKELITYVQEGSPYRMQYTFGKLRFDPKKSKVF